LLSGLSGELLSASQFLRIDAVDEEVRIEAGFETSARISPTWVDRDQRPAKLLKASSATRCRLKSKRHHEVVARERLAPGERADRAPAGVDLDLLEPVTRAAPSRRRPRCRACDVVGAL